MNINLPYFKQDSDYTCGPAVFQMLCAFYNRSQALDHLNDLLQPDPIHGTSHSKMISAARKLKFDVLTKENSTLKEIKEFIDKNTPVIINYIEPSDNDGHYAVVTNLNENEITLADPWNGKDFNLPVKEFDVRWKSGYEDSKKWFMVLRPL